MTVLDSIDEQIVQLLGVDARQSSDSIAKHLKVSPATVRRRIRRLIKEGVIRIAALVDDSKAGFPLTAIIAFHVAHENLEQTMEMLASRPEVEWVSTTTGRFDVLALSRFRSTDELASFVQRELADIEGIKDSETFICLQVKKGRNMQV